MATPDSRAEGQDAGHRGPITVVAQFDILPGREDEFLAAIHAHMPANIQDKGLVRFYAHRGLRDRQRFLLYEDWESEADFEASMKAPWRESYMRATTGLWGEERRLDRYTQEDIRFER